MIIALTCSGGSVATVHSQTAPTQAVQTTHGYAAWGQLKYPANFTHLGYVNPTAPKGGELFAVSGFRVSNFDKYNPFTLKGTAPAYLQNMVFESLLEGVGDELASGYGLLAQSVQVASDGLSATFTLRGNAKFSNGDPVLPKDVVHSFTQLTSKYATPAIRAALDDVAGVDEIAPLTVKFRFKKAQRELPLVVGSLPIFSHRWGAGKPFDQVVTDLPIGSAAYKVGKVDFGRDITYERRPDYWGAALPLNVGRYNFDRITFKIYKDTSARLEALKAGEIDMQRFFSAGDWTRRTVGGRFRTGELVKVPFAHKQPAGGQAHYMNLRRPLFADVRVRQALNLAMDYEWMNRQLFYGLYERVSGRFGNTDCAPSGTASGAERALLQELQQKYPNEVPQGVLGELFAQPRTDQGKSLRDNLRQARELLAQAGWRVDPTRGDGLLRNAKGQAFEFEYLDSKEGGTRTLLPWMQQLKKLGITMKFRAVDFALYQKRLEEFDFDMTGLGGAGTQIPGNELTEQLGSKAANTPHSNNLGGLQNKAVDALIERIVDAKSLDTLYPACRALDRILIHQHVVVPMWSNNKHNVAYKAPKLAHPATLPLYYDAETWAMSTWWQKLEYKGKP